MKCLCVIKSYFWTSEGLVTKTKNESQEKITIEIGSQIHARVAISGRGIRQRFWTKSYFWYLFEK